MGSIFSMVRQAVAGLVGYFLPEIGTLAYRRRSAKARYSFSHGSLGHMDVYDQGTTGTSGRCFRQAAGISSLVQQYCPTSAPFPEMVRGFFYGRLASEGPVLARSA